MTGTLVASRRSFCLVFVQQHYVVCATSDFPGSYCIQEDFRGEEERVQRVERGQWRPCQRAQRGRRTRQEQGARRHHRRRQLRLVAGAGRRVLPERAGGRARARADARQPGRLPRPDIEFTAAFDVVESKVGKDLSEAIFAEPNNTFKFADVPNLGVTVHRGMTHDGLGKYLSEVVTKAPGPTADIVQILKDTKTDVVVTYLPVGSEMATKWYVEQILEAGCGFVNCIPVFIAREPYWQKRFEERGLPIIGDDIKSQVGATITHRVLTHLFRERGVQIDRTYQLNFGGNTDFFNMLERERLESKKISKTNAVTSQIPYDVWRRERARRPDATTCPG